MGDGDFGRYRKKLKLSQRALAELLGLASSYPQKTIWRYENDPAYPPPKSAQWLLKLLVELPTASKIVGLDEIRERHPYHPGVGRPARKKPKDGSR